MDYGFEHEGKVYTPNGTAGITPAESPDRNAEIARAELAHWATRPDRMTAYFSFPAETERTATFGNRQYRPEFWPSLTGAYVSLWLGQRIGIVTRAHVYRHNKGYRFVALTVKGTNGATYRGRASWDWGQVINLRRSK